MIDVFLQYSYLLLSTFICLLLFTNTTFPCYCYYCTIPLHFEYKITRMPTCRRSDHQKINPKKCTLIKFWKYGRAEADFVVSWTIRESIQKMNSYQILTIGKSRGRFCRRLDQSKEIYSYQILTIRKSRGRFCRRLDHQSVNPKKGTHITFWQSGRAEADFVVGWTIQESNQRILLLSNFDNREEQRPILS